MTTPTPRTDAILEIASIEDRYLPLRDLARQLERELAAREEELAEARDALQFVERWANYHGVKPTCTAKAALSAIQHYPPIREITESYKDGKIPETRNPWEELSAATDRAEKAEAELARTQEAFESLTLQVSELELSRDAAVKDAERYRWMKSNCRYEFDETTPKEPQLVHATEDGPNQNPRWREELDAAIDAAISAKGER